MANPVCTIASKVEAYPCFSGTTLTSREQDALQFYFYIREFAALSGFTYSESTLLFYADAVAKNVIAMTSDQLRTEQLGVAYSNAITAGASVSSNIQTLKDEIKCIMNYPSLESMVVVARCVLGVHKTFPQ
jgi:hypothetical protein